MREIRRKESWHFGTLLRETDRSLLSATTQPLIRINKRLLEHLQTQTELSEDDAAEQLVFYSYAILCSNAYLERFKGALFAASDSETSPRIPIPLDEEMFLKISKQGKALAELEKAEISITIPAKLKGDRKSVV